MKIIHKDAAPAAIGTYSQAIVSGGFVFTSGQIPILPSTGKIEGKGVAEQAEQVIANLRAVLESADSSLEKVIKTTCFLTDMAMFPVFNDVYAKYFKTKPARSTVAVKDLPLGALVEIEAVAESSAC